MELVNEEPVCPAIAVPPVATVYHANVFPVTPDPLTCAAGTPGPHCVLFTATGVTGAGLIVTAGVVAVETQPVAVVVAVTVNTCDTGAPELFVIVVLTEEPVSPVPGVHA